MCLCVYIYLLIFLCISRGEIIDASERLLDGLTGFSCSVQAGSSRGEESILTRAKYSHERIDSTSACVIYIFNVCQRYECGNRIFEAYFERLLVFFFCFGNKTEKY